MINENPLSVEGKLLLGINKTGTALLEIKVNGVPVDKLSSEPSGSTQQVSMWSVPGENTVELQWVDTPQDDDTVEIRILDLRGDFGTEPNCLAEQNVAAKDIANEGRYAFTIHIDQANVLNSKGATLVLDDVTRQEAEKVAQELRDSFVSEDLDKLLSLYETKIVDLSPMFNLSTEQGRKSQGKFLKMLLGDRLEPLGQLNFELVMQGRAIRVTRGEYPLIQIKNGPAMDVYFGKINDIWQVVR